ncbi:hypothetical protein A4G18_00365 [Pasteurellaceae bacterium Pebbles2]|nr:hypothetical protein [Pasteurellaceae bacterium Pebbles2]
MKQTFNKIEQSVYTTLTNFTQLDDGSIQLKYVVGVGSDQDGEIQNFSQLSEVYKYINSEQATELNNIALTKDDLGKTPQEILMRRCYEYLKSVGEILV